MPESSPGGVLSVDHHMLIQMSINWRFVLKASLPHSIWCFSASAALVHQNCNAAAVSRSCKTQTPLSTVSFFLFFLPPLQTSHHLSYFSIVLHNLYLCRIAGLSTAPNTKYEILHYAPVQKANFH